MTINQQLPPSLYKQINMDLADLLLFFNKERISSLRWLLKEMNYLKSFPKLTKLFGVFFQISVC